jgi:hypothetical protein
VYIFVDLQDGKQPDSIPIREKDALRVGRTMKKGRLEVRKQEQKNAQKGHFCVFLAPFCAYFAANLYIIRVHIGGFRPAKRFRWGNRAQVGDGRVGQR